MAQKHVRIQKTADKLSTLLSSLGNVGPNYFITGYFVDDLFNQLFI